VLGFQQSLVSIFKLVSIDVEAGECQTLPGSFFSLFVAAQISRSRSRISTDRGLRTKRGTQTFYGLLRGLVLDKSSDVE